MAAAWFIWRSYHAVRDQWEVATRKWRPKSDPPVFILETSRRHPGTVACVFNQAGFENSELSRGAREDRFAIQTELGETDSPYDRLKCALQLGKLNATVARAPRRTADPGKGI